MYLCVNSTNKELYLAKPRTDELLLKDVISQPQVSGRWANWPLSGSPDLTEPKQKHQMVCPYHAHFCVFNISALISIRNSTAECPQVTTLLA